MKSIATRFISILLLLPVIASNQIQAQIVFTKPVVTQADNSNITIEKVSVTPNSISFELEYDGGKAWKFMKSAWLCNMVSVPHLYVYGATQFSLTDGTKPRGDAATVYQLYTGPLKLNDPPKRKTHIVKFPFYSGRYFFNLFNERYTKKNNYFIMDFAECPDKYPVKQGGFGCFNFKGIYLPFTQAQLHTLYLQNEINFIFKKDEFETSAAYAQRTHKDSVLQRLQKKYDNLEELFLDQKIQQLKEVKPAISYNADMQRFTIQYAGTGIDPVVIQVPLAEAPAFKDKVQNGQLIFNPYSSEFIRKSETEFYLANFVLTDKSLKKFEYKNLHGENKQAEWSRQYKQAVFKLLEEQYPKGKLWADMQ